MPGSLTEIRGAFYRTTRDFFATRGVLEVMPPVLADTTVTDPHIASIEAGSGQFLQTSPEFAMKKLLAREPQPIYSLGPAFRAGEVGARHQSEFLMLEWYRPGFSLAQLEGEIADLLRTLWQAFGKEFPSPKRCTYASLFQQQFDANPHDLPDAELLNLVNQYFPELTDHINQGSRNDCLDTLFSMGVEPHLVEPTFVVEFPASQVSLAKLGEPSEPGAKSQKVALRSELYWQGLELANAYDELTDGEELRARAHDDNLIRQELGLPQIPVDEALLAALDDLPDCCGVALGVDRLLMLLTGADEIRDINPFMT